MQSEGEVEICIDPFHEQATAQNAPEYIADCLIKRAEHLRRIRGHRQPGGSPSADAGRTVIELQPATGKEPGNEVLATTDRAALERLREGMTWIERNVPRGIEIVAAALAGLNPNEVPALAIPSQALLRRAITETWRSVTGKLSGPEPRWCDHIIDRVLNER